MRRPRSVREEAPLRSERYLVGIYVIGAGESYPPTGDLQPLVPRTDPVSRRHPYVCRIIGARWLSRFPRRPSPQTRLYPPPSGQGKLRLFGFGTPNFPNAGKSLFFVRNAT